MHLAILIEKSRVGTISFLLPAKLLAISTHFQLPPRVISCAMARYVRLINSILDDCLRSNPVNGCEANTLAAVPPSR